MKTFNQILSEAKASKAEANYRDVSQSNQVCEDCTMWRPPNKCSAVSGEISPKGWCEYFRKSKRAS